jgi:cathepsin A (carboxypeptidase C)
MISFKALALLSVCSVVSALPEEDRVPELEGVSLDKYNMFSGYMALGDSTKQIHYVFVDSQNNNETDPLLIWLNGGPGCSSMLGFMQENGPWVMEDGTNYFVENNFSWNSNASVLYIEQPAGVGYSYCNSTEDCYSDDNVSGDDNLAALLAWFEKFPEYKNHDLYISGESYGGIYVPYFMWKIDTYNKNVTQQEDAINLKGILVGNGVTNWTYDTMPATIEQLYWRSLLDEGTYESMKAENCDYSRIEFDPNSLSAECAAYLNTTMSYISQINIYNLYGKCWTEESKEQFDYEQNKMVLKKPSNQELQVVDGKLTSKRKFMTSKDYTPWLFKNQKDDSLSLPDCTFGQPILDYLNNVTVKQQLHIPEYVQAWDMCKDNINYTMFEKGSQFIYEALRGQYRILKYSGDMDGSVPTVGTLGWINALGWETKKPWRQYKADTMNNLAGWVWNLDGLDFVTVHGAGHMVPQDQRERAHYMLNSFLFQSGPFAE